jgi:hypothetical protein
LVIRNKSENPKVLRINDLMIPYFFKYREYSNHNLLL